MSTKVTVEWNPVSASVPNRSGFYLVTWQFANGVRHVDFAEFDGGKFQLMYESLDARPIAWTKLPEAFDPEEQPDMHPDAVTARRYIAGDPETVKALEIFDEDE